MKKKITIKKIERAAEKKKCRKTNNDKVKKMRIYDCELPRMHQ